VAPTRVDAAHFSRDTGDFIRLLDAHGVIPPGTPGISRRQWNSGGFLMSAGKTRWPNVHVWGAELIRPRSPWRGFDEVELGTLEYVWWFNNHRLLEIVGHVPPAEHEEASYRRLQTPPELESLNTNGLR
jgi:hypothetical protein